MALLLGIDTGGTFTDAVLLDNTISASNEQVIAKAKSLTTRHDFAIGIAEAAGLAIKQAGCKPDRIGMVSLSTTLATNALVEGQGARSALVAIGFAQRDLANAGLEEALGDDPVLLLPGGHNTLGEEAKPLDMTELEERLDVLAKTVSGFAIAGYFAVRNPQHELAVRDLIMQRTGMAVTCSHELSAKLNGPKRALTTVLNARLVPVITRLIEATRRSLARQKIEAPLMIVRGDGALVGADFATRRPIETILSGPAASLVGAHYLTGCDTAFVNDIGGTTSDVAMLAQGRPKLDPLGARVGGHRTMVEAVAMHTFGLGGDSQVWLGGSSLNPRIELGPGRLVPISLLAHSWPDIVHVALDRQLKSALHNRHHGRFAFRSGMGRENGLSVVDAALYQRISSDPEPLEEILSSTRQITALNRLVGQGLVQVAGLTPSDATHALGQHRDWDSEAAGKALQLFARQKDGAGGTLFRDPLELARAIVSRVQRRSAEIVLESALNGDGKDGSELLEHSLVRDVLERREASGIGQQPAKETDAVGFSLKLNHPFIGLGASAHAYHPAAARLLDTSIVVPQHADVANAIGAVVGQVSMKAEILVTQPVEGRFHATGADHPFASEAEAVKWAGSVVQERARALALQAGTKEVEVQLRHHSNRATIESREMLIEARIIAVATGRPPIAG